MEHLFYSFCFVKARILIIETCKSMTEQYVFVRQYLIGGVRGG